MIADLPPPAIDGAWRVDTYGAKLIPARNGRGFEELRLFEYSSMALYGKFASPVFQSILKNFLSWGTRQPASILLAAPADLEDMSAAVSQLSIGAEEDTAELLNRLRALRDYAQSLRALLDERGLLLSPNAKYLLAVVPVSAKRSADREVQQLLAELVALSKTTSLRLLILIEDARHLSPSLKADLSWQGFTGADQLSYCRDRYTMEVVPGMSTRVDIGIAIDSLLESARTMNDLSYEPTKESLERKHAIAEDAESYRRFLEGLNDGN